MPLDRKVVYSGKIKSRVLHLFTRTMSDKVLSWNGKKDWIGVPYRELSEPEATKHLRILQEDGVQLQR